MKLWYDPWLSGSELAQPVGPAPLDSKAWLVSDLFLPDSVDWDERKIGDVLPALRETILAIKPSRFRGPDRRVWLPSKDGNYCTKSGYQVAAQGAAAEDPLLLAPSFNWFEEVWNLHCSPKIQLFLWKALSGAIPSGSQLASRIPSFEPSCIRCRDLESTGHILFGCPFAQRVWNLAPVEDMAAMPVFTDVSEGLPWLRKRKALPPTGLGHCSLYPWICWTLWNTRNQKVFNNIHFSEQETILKAIQDATEWQQAQEPNLKKTSRIPAPLAPAGGSHTTILIHSDAAWSNVLNVAGLGWTLAFPGLPQKKNSALCEFVSSLLMAESLAVRSALCSALNLGAQAVRLNSDCQVLTKAINSKTPLVEIHGPLLDILELVLLFQSFQCCFIPRSSNILADSLAKEALALYARNF